jgi:hypothetical protein
VAGDRRLRLEGESAGEGDYEAWQEREAVGGSQGADGRALPSRKGSPSRRKKLSLATLFELGPYFRRAQALPCPSLHFRYLG